MGSDNSKEPIALGVKPEETISNIEKPSEEVILNLQDPPTRVDGIRLNVGSGVDYKPKFLNIDKYDSGADVDWDLDDMPLGDNSVAQIIAYEVLEHVSKHELFPILKEFHRVLKPDGQLLAVVPDMIDAAKKFLANPDDEWTVARIYGSQAHPGQFHKTAWTTSRVLPLFGSAGFRLVNVAEFKEANDVGNIYVEAVK